MRFFDRFRTAMARYAAGVHELGDPAGEGAIVEVERRVGPLPPGYRDFLLQWNGGYLFHDDYAIHGVAGARAELQRLARAGDDQSLIELGFTPSRRLLLDGRGRVLSLDSETEELSVEGSAFEPWLDATLAREAVIYDREGEFREEAFAGGELSAAAQRKRAQSALKIDPGSPAWHEEMANLLLEGGEPESAIEELLEVVALEPPAAAAWLLLGKLQREAGDKKSAAASFARAAEHERDDQEAAFAFASAARAAAEAELDSAADFAQRAARRMPAFVEQQRAAANHLIEEGDLDGAGERLALAAAVTPDDPALRSEMQRLRARQALRII